MNAKIRILTFHYNLPKLIELQHKSFSKFLTEDHEIIVFNDARNDGLAESIEKTCQQYGIQCIRYKQELHLSDPLNLKIKEWLDNPRIYSHIGFHNNDIASIATQPSVRHCHVIQYALDHYGYQHNDIVVIADGDIFPIRSFNIRDLVKEVPIAGLRRFIASENVDYLWVPFIAIDMKRIANKDDLKFHVDVIGNKLHDTGAHSYHFLKKGEIKARKYLGTASTEVRHWSQKHLYHFGFNDREINLIKSLPWPLCVEFHIQNQLLHFGASSFGLQGADTKLDFVTQFINEITQ